MEKESLKHKIMLTFGVAALAALILIGVVRCYDNTDAVYKYSLLEDGSALVEGYSGVPVKLEIPAELDGHTVSAISNSAFTNQTKLKSVVMPETLKEVGDYAFYGCTKLKSVEAPGVESVGRSAFYGCSKLKSVTLSENLRTIKDSAFSRCTLLRSLEIPASCETIEPDAFLACESLTLKCAGNETAMAVAAQYGIPTEYTDSADWQLIKVALVTLVLLAVLGVGGLVFRQVMRGRQKK